MFALSLIIPVAAGTFAFPGDVAARSVRVCPGPALPPSGCFDIDTSTIGGRAFEDYVVSRPGKLVVDPVRRRAELQRLEPYDAAQLCAVNPFAMGRDALPTISFSAATVRLFETRAMDGAHVRVREYAVASFENLRSSEGFVAARFGLTFNRQHNDPTLRLEFFPSTESNLAGIPGLDRDVYLNVDVASGAIASQGVEGLPASLRRTLLGIAYRLQDVVAAIPDTIVVPGAIDPLWSKQELAQVAATFSAIGFSVAQPTFPPVIALTCELGDVPAGTCAETPQLIQFRDYLIRYGAHYLQSADPTVGNALLANLKSWAQANALSSFPGLVVGSANQSDFRPKYELQWLLVPMVQTWSFLRSAALVSPADRALIDSWLDRLVLYAVEPVGGPQNPENPFNVGYLTRGLKMAWGALRGDNVALAEGMEKVLMGLHQMRSDGSFPREVARGACALRYQDTMILNLLFIAEVAATQGYDAYGIGVNGKSLHTAVTFLLDAVENPSVVAGYASQDPANCTNAPPLPAFDLASVVESPNGFSYSAWLEPYIARFPGHPNAPRLRALLSGGLDASRPVFHPHSGGNTSCFSAGAAPPPITAPGTAVEYFHGPFGHYFLTIAPDEIDGLDSGVFPGWSRTGPTFAVYPLNSPGARNVCRFFTTTFAPKSSHFYTTDVVECEGVKRNPDWQFESLVVGLRPTNAAGGCADGTRPLHRLYNEGQTGAPNHRYTTSTTIRGQMLAQGFVSEGIAGCVPQ